MQIIQTLGMFARMVFPAWPAILLLPLLLGKGENTLGQMLVMWAVMLFIWLAKRAVPTIPSYAIPEPINTYLFFAAGVLIFIFARFGKSR